MERRFGSIPSPFKCVFSPLFSCFVHKWLERINHKPGREKRPRCHSSICRASCPMLVQLYLHGYEYHPGHLWVGKSLLRHLCGEHENKGLELGNVATIRKR